ncbi:MAG: antitoxin [Chloroflexota bacterium]
MPGAIAKVFTSGNSQAIRLPKEFRLNTDEVFIRRSGDSLIITPRMTTWEGFEEGLGEPGGEFDITGGLSEDLPRKSFD